MCRGGSGNGGGEGQTPPVSGVYCSVFSTHIFNLTDNLLACETATTESRFSDWLKANASWLGNDYANELRRNWHPSLADS